MRLSARVMLAVAALGFGACTVKQTTAPPLSGPSDFATSIGVTATPDSISQDGASQSAIAVTAHDANGRPMNGVPIRLDIMVGGVVQDFGTLSTKSIVTGSDGRAVSVYTAPAAPPPGTGGSGTRVSILATPTGSNFQASQTQSVDIRLVPIGVILPPAGTPTASFTVTPTPVSAGTAAIFDASASTIGSGASSITSYSWTFGDGSSGSGKTATHTFSAPATYTVTLTVTNDRSLSASTSQQVAVSALALPSPKFVFSPTSPSVGQTIIFNADQSTAAPGHTVTTFNWNFGDGTTATGFTASHQYAAAGTYNVVLAVLDDIGQKATTSTTVTVATAGGGGGGGSTTAAFVFSPSSPVIGQVVFFNASGSTAATGHSLVKYAWDFGDGTTFTGSTSSANHTFANQGTYSVILIVTDDAGTTAKTTSAVTVAGQGAGAPVAKFTSSPTQPVVNQQVVFDASTSTAAIGLNITDYAWVFGDGTPIVHTTSKTIAHSFASANTFVVSLTVTDNAGGTNATSASVTVAALAGAPTANFTFSPTVGVAGQPITFTDTSVAGGAAIVSWTWNFGDGSALLNISSPPAANGNTTHTFAAGTYSITLTVTDASGRTSTVSKAVTVQ